MALGPIYHHGPSCSVLNAHQVSYSLALSVVSRAEISTVDGPESSTVHFRTIPSLAVDILSLKPKIPFAFHSIGAQRPCHLTKSLVPFPYIAPDL